MRKRINKATNPTKRKNTKYTNKNSLYSLSARHYLPKSRKPHFILASSMVLESSSKTSNRIMIKPMGVKKLRLLNPNRSAFTTKISKFKRSEPYFTTITALRKATSRIKIPAHIKIRFSVRQTNLFPFTTSITNNKLHSSTSTLIKVKSQSSNYFQAFKLLSMNISFTL
jgi:hypothetical protein